LVDVLITPGIQTLDEAKRQPGMTGRAKLTELGGLYRWKLIALVLYMVGGLSISAFPLFSGFVSKTMVGGGGTGRWRLGVAAAVAGLGQHLAHRQHGAVGGRDSGGVAADLLPVGEIPLQVLAAYRTAHLNIFSA
jgi:hypothetical protein